MNSVTGIAGIVLALSGSAALMWHSFGGVRSRPGPAAALRVDAGVLLLGSAVAMAALIAALVTDDFSVRYVAENHARATPPLFAVATAWAALEGSIVLWGLVLAGYLFAVSRGVGLDDRLGAAALGVLGAIAVFFFGLMLLAANPFEVLANPPADGPGPNPLLQNNVLMAVHPPLLYLGYVGFSVPFAFAMGALMLGDAGRTWLRRTRRWSLIAWVFLTAGIAVGALWSYEVLGWGGYWAWDPVENASFMPWLAGTAFVHSAIAQARRGALRAWNISLVIVTFALTILGTFLTRSGVVASVHSFTQSPVGPPLLGFLVVILFASLGLLAARVHLVASAPRVHSLLSREGAFLLNNLLLCAFTFTVLLGTTYPILLEALTGAEVSVGRPFFDRFAIPISVALLAAVAAGPLLPYRGARPGLLWERLRGPVALGLVVGAMMAVVDGATSTLVLVTVLAVTVVAAVGGEAWRTAPEGNRGPGAVRNFARQRGYWGGQMSHIGLAVSAFAIALTSTLGTDATMTLATGEQTAFGSYGLRFDGLVEQVEPNRTAQIAEIAVLDGDNVVATLGPRLNRYGNQATAVGTPSVRTTVREDLYVALRRLEPDEIAIEVYRYPFMWLLWAGGALMVAGGVWALTGRRRERPAVAPLDDSLRPDEVGAARRTHVGA